MADKVQTAFRLHLKTVNDLDALADAPPGWLEECAPGPIQNRTDVVERLVFLAVKHRWFGAVPSDHPQESGMDRDQGKRTGKATKPAKR